MSVWRWWWRGSFPSVEVEDAGLGWRAELVREGAGEVCARGSRVGGKGCGGVGGVCGGALKNRASSGGSGRCHV